MVYKRQLQISSSYDNHMFGQFYNFVYFGYKFNDETIDVEV